MAIEYVGKSAFAASTGALSVGAVPGVQAGDLILLFVESANQTVALPSGFTGAPGSPVGSGTAGADASTRISVFYRVATGADSSTSVSNSGDHTVAFKLAYRNVDTSVPIEANASLIRNTPITLPAVTTVTANAMVLYAIAISEDYEVAHPAVTFPNVAALTGLSVPHAQVSSQGTGGGIGVITGFKAAPGNTGSGSADYGFSAALAILALSLRPVLGDITGTSAITEATFDSASAASAVVVSAQSSASDQRDTSTATASVRAVRYATASVADAADISTASAIVVVPPVPSTPAPWGDLGELARHELAANELAQDSGAVYVYTEMFASAGAAAALHGGAKLSANLQAGAQATASLVGGMILSGELAASAAASAGFGAEVVFVGQAMFQTAVEADFQAAFTVESELTAEATATASFAYAANPELHVTARASAQFHSSVAHSTAVHTGASSGATLAGATIATADMQAAPQSAATLRGGAVAIGELSATARAVAVMRASWSVGRDVQMQAGASFTARGESVVVGGLSATPKATAVLVGDFGLSAEAILHTGAKALPSMRAGAIHFAGMSVGATAHFNAHGGEVRTGRLTAAASGAFDPNAGQSYHAYLPPAREGVVVPADARGALVPFEDRAAVGEGVA